jgi:hypothetical protein
LLSYRRHEIFEEDNMDNTTLLIIVIVILLLLGGGWYGRGRWYQARIFAPYIDGMLWCNSRGRPLIAAPAAFIHPCQPIVAKQPPSGLSEAFDLNRPNLRKHILNREILPLFTPRVPE